MRAGWWALVVGLVLGGGAALALAVPAPPRAEVQGPVLRALGLERGPGLDARRAAAVAAATERCLASAGVRRSIPIEPPPPIPDGDLDPVAWADRWGFGITTATTWRTAPVSAPRSADPLEVRCRETAADEVYGLRDRRLRPLRPALEALATTIDGDPASRAADEAWVDCAARAASIVDPPLPAPTEPGRLEALRSWFAGHRARSDPLVASLERRVAAAIARCDATRVEARRVAAIPHERAFVRAHGAELASIGATIRAAEAGFPAASP